MSRPPAELSLIHIFILNLEEIRRLSVNHVLPELLTGQLPAGARCIDIAVSVDPLRYADIVAADITTGEVVIEDAGMRRPNGNGTGNTQCHGNPVNCPLLRDQVDTLEQSSQQDSTQ